jgi:hypothetical protein
MKPISPRFLARRSVMREPYSSSAYGRNRPAKQHRRGGAENAGSPAEMQGINWLIRLVDGSFQFPEVAINERRFQANRCVQSLPKLRQTSEPFLKSRHNEVSRFLGL